MSVGTVDQASGLRKLVQASRPVFRSRDRRAGGARVVAIASGKGGVGKTVVATNLAIALARRGRRIVLVDADLGTANVDVLLNVEANYDVSHVIRGERLIDDVVTCVAPGLQIVVGASGLASAADLSACDRLSLVDGLSSLESRADLLLLDCGAGISQNVLAFARAADELLVITTPEPTALTDAYALIKVVSRLPGPPDIGIVVNQARTEREAAVVNERVASVAARFLGVSVRCTGHVLRDEHVPLAVRQRTPVIVRYPRCPAAGCISTLASRIDRTVSKPASNGGFFRRVVELFY